MRKSLNDSFYGVGVDDIEEEMIPYESNFDDQDNESKPIKKSMEKQNHTNIMHLEENDGGSTNYLTAKLNLFV